MNNNMHHIVEQFQVSGHYLNAVPYGTGHINDTYLVTSEDSDGPKRYVFQRINHSIFKDPPSVMSNMVRVTEHIQNKLQHLGMTDITRRALTVILAISGESYYLDSDGNYWRCVLFVECTQAYDVLETPQQAYQAAKAFGEFQRYLADLPDPKLYETSPDFHNTSKRLKDFMAILAKDPQNRANQVKQEIQFVLEHAGFADQLLELAGKGLIPERVTHNDTKISNVLFDNNTHEGICVIDLDTVMPGLSLYDFGDMVRTATCKAAEDEQDLSKIQMDIEYFEQLANGYAQEAADFLTNTEKQQLVFAGKLITFEQMIRFLGDYLNGDTYYKIHRPEHNLDRARTQMKLVQSIIEQEEAMNKISQDIWQAVN